MVVALLAVLAVSAAVILHWLRNISEDDIAGAVMEATEADAAGVALNSTFVLNFDSAVSSAAVRRCLSVEPEIEFGLHQGSSRQQVLVVPDQPLEEDTLYTFRLGLDEARSAWAFQTAAGVRAASHFPDDRATVNSVTGIEFTLDRLLYADLDQIAAYFSITPEVAGSFEQQGRVLRFLPDQPLTPGTVYQVSLSAGLPFADTASVLAEPVEFSFEAEPAAADWELAEGEYVYPSGQRPTFRIESGSGAALPASLQLQLYTFDQDGYVELLTAIADSRPVWSSSFRQLTGCDVSAGRLLTSVDVDPAAYGSFSLPDIPADGYYLLRVTADGVSRDRPFAVSRIAAAALPHADDLLLWLHDGKTGDRLTRAEITDAISGKTVSADSMGAALLEGVAAPAVCVIKAQSAELVLPVWECGSTDGTPLLWRYLYLSQERCQSGDELYFWGLVQPRGGAPLEYNGVTVYLFDPDGAEVLHQYCPLDGNFFHDSITVPQLPKGLYRLAIWQSGRELVSRSFAVGAALLPAAESSGSRAGVELNATYYRPGDSFTASCPLADEDELFLLADRTELTWDEAASWVYVGTFRPRNQLDVYCGALSYNGGSCTYCAASPLYLDYEARRLQVSLEIDEDDNACTVLVSDSDGMPLADAEVAVSLSSGGEPDVSPADALFSDYGGSGFAGEEVTSAPGGAGSGKCLFFTVLTTDENGRAETQWGFLTADAGCWLSAQAVYDEDRLLAGAARSSVSLPPAPRETAARRGDAQVSGFAVLNENDKTFTGTGENTLLIAAAPEQTQALSLLGRALTSEDELTAAAAGEVLVHYSGNMMRDLLAGCGFNLAAQQQSNGSIRQDILTSALMALLQPDGVSAHALIKYFDSVMPACGEGDEYAVCLAALAALDQPQLNDVRLLLVRDDLIFSAQCWLSIAAALCGDGQSRSLIKDQPREAEEWALYGLALAYAGDHTSAIHALTTARDKGGAETGLYAVVTAALLLNDSGAGAAGRLSQPPEPIRQQSYKFTYTIDETDHYNSFAGDSKYQLPLNGFSGQLRIRDSGGAGFCCFSVSPAAAEQ
ncbi:MAG: hypothetical protein IK116_03700 [Firmicutes bacterium]|nr:hypothetical protein [Bacillota bacterium]